MNEQGLLDSLNRECIQILGNTYWYIPRDTSIEDLVLGEDVISSFPLAIPIEMYLSNPMGFSGDKEMFSKFGLELRNSYKLVVNKGRWESEVKTQFDGLIANGETNYIITDYIRPREGDLVYDPMTKYLMEIKFVDHDVEFYALGKNYQYYLSCEAFQYQSESITTGVPEIDIFATMNTDMVNNYILLEDGTRLLLEDGSFMISEGLTIPIRTYGTDYKKDAKNIGVNIVNPFA